MLYLLAPSKTLSMEYSLPRAIEASDPLFKAQARQIAAIIQARSDIGALMQVSAAIAAQVADMYRTWGDQHAPALYAYRGDVYRWFFADTLTAADVRWAQQHMLILSGLYGALRPLDQISPYRLEMKTKLPVAGAPDLYEFWGTRLAALADQYPGEVICNLSSDEYARVVTKYTKKRVVTPVFLDNKTDGSVGTVPIYSKMMRGVMMRWAIDNRVDTPDRLCEFTTQGYRYDNVRSTQDAPTFYRDVPKPIRVEK